ncbi:MAG: hypothetical protein ABI790_02360 [Betaproteobacteria bacterium]
MLYAQDARWWAVYAAEAARGFAGERWTAAPALKGLINWVEVIDAPGLSTNAARIHSGLHSGYQAIGLAYLWGASRIILLGYDLQRGAAGESHFHGDHAGGLPNLGTMGEWARRMVPLAQDLRRRGVEVVNASRRSAITCFERAPIEKALNPGKPAILLHGMLGLGDNIYQRAVIRELTATREVWLATPWPQLYADLPVRCVKPETRLRTQAKNIARVDAGGDACGHAWASPPRTLRPQRVTYAGAGGTMLAALCAALGVAADRLTFDLPPLPPPLPSPDRPRRPYIVIRPATIRSEWPAAARNPAPEYLARAADVLREHFHLVSVADLARDVEWPVGPLPVADETFHGGELAIGQLLALVAGAAGVVGGVGWIVPAAIAARVPLFLIFGGWGKDNGPQRIFDPRLDTALVESVLPQRFCRCGDRDHRCDKTIDDFEPRLQHWLLGLLARGSPAMAARAGHRLVSGQRAAV